MRKTLMMWVLAGACLMGCGEKPSVSTYTDKRDGKVYKIVKIGSQVWFAENLNYAAEGSKCYGEDGRIFIKILVERDDNNKIKGFKEITETLTDAEIQANCAKYGRLYNWETALKACPDGTHLPTDEEWAMLENYVGDSTAGTKLKSSTGWNSDDGVPSGTDNYDFSALPGGVSISDGNFGDAGNYGYWWNATESDSSLAWISGMGYQTEGVFGSYYSHKTDLYSVRCVQDDEKGRK